VHGAGKGENWAVPASDVDVVPLDSIVVAGLRYFGAAGAETGVASHTAHIAGIAAALAAPPGDELGAPLGYEAVFEAVAEVLAEAVAEAVAALVVPVAAAAAAVVVCTGSIGVIENGITSHPSPDGIAQRVVLVDSSVQCALEVIGNCGIEYKLPPQLGPFAPHRRTRDAG
jgi:hypothetical protein